MASLQLGRAGEAIRGGLLNFLEGGAPIRRGLAGLLEGDVEPLKQAVGYGQPFPQLTPEQMRQQAFDVAMDVNNPMQNIGGLLGITAWHGSPYKFAPTAKNPLGEFNLSKMGSGEGAQAYGYGSYLAESPEVAKGYQIQNAYKAFDIGEEATKRGIPLSARGRGEFIRQANANKDPVKAAKALQNANASSRSIPAEDLQKMFADYQERGGGALYKVDIPDEYIPKMLDWDKPLSQQSPEVQKAWEKFKSSPAGKRAEKSIGQSLDTLISKFGGEIKGQDIHSTMYEGFAKKQGGEAAKVNELLKNNGILGIRYLDGGSRGAGQGSSNYVVFDPSILNILERQ